jgi:signal transduction histidine kinase
LVINLRDTSKTCAMRVVAKFALAFFLVSAICLAFYAYLRATWEAQRAEADVAVNLTSIGDVLRHDLMDRPRDRPYAESTVARLREHRRDLEVEYLDGVAPLPEDRTDVDPDTATPRRVRVELPMRDRQGAIGTLRLAEVVPSSKALLWNQLRDELLATGAMAALAFVLAVGLGALLIGRPLARMVEQARRIGRGDLSQRLKSGGRDEIGILKTELNAMCDQLIEARRRADDEATARVETLEQLRHLDRLRTVGTLASSMAHELGTPLNVLLLRGQSLASGEVTADELPQAGRTIVGQVEKMSTLVRQLLDFSRARKTPKGTADLLEVATAASSLLSMVAKKHKVKLEVEAKGSVTVPGNAGQLEQALTNLVVNGIHAMPRGGKLTIRVRPPSVQRKPHSDRDLNVARIEVADEGVGIESAVLERIFDPFYTTKAKGTGTGLGLSVAGGILEEHDGWISAESEVGRGSTFTLYLPAGGG